MLYQPFYPSTPHPTTHPSSTEHLDDPFNALQSLDRLLHVSSSSHYIYLTRYITTFSPSHYIATVLSLSLMFAAQPKLPTFRHAETIMSTIDMSESLRPIRNLSDKENPLPFSLTFSPSATATNTAPPKPRLGGVGRAPREHRKSGVYKLYTRRGSISRRPKFRTTSVQRAKLRAISQQNLKRTLKFNAPAVVVTTRASGEVENDNKEEEDTASGGGEDEKEKDVPKKMYHLRLISVDYRPSPPISLNTKRVSPARITRAPLSRFGPSSKLRVVGRVPIQLPPALRRPSIPPVTYDENGDYSVVSRTVQTCLDIAYLL